MRKILIYFIALIAVAVTSCSTEGNEGSIYGVVTVSETAEPMRATGVELYKKGSGALLLKTVTYDDGHFEFCELQPGYYSLVVVAEGYENVSYNVEVEVGRTARADIQMKKLQTYMDVITESVDGHNDGTADFSASYSIQSSGYAADEVGFIYGQNPHLTMSNGLIIKANFTSQSKPVYIAYASGLQKGTWYALAYAKNSIGYTFGNILSFEINDETEVATKPVSNITDNIATLNGLIVFDGVPPYSEKGFVYSSRFTNPTVDDPQSETTKVVVSGKSKEFSANISGLTDGTTYYVRAFAKGETTVYGKTVSFVAGSSKEYIVIDNLAIQLTDLSKGVNCKSALELCSQSRVGGFNDWRLPTVGELSFMYANMDKIGRFEPKRYWSSTIFYSSSYYYVDFKDGSSHFTDYSYNYAVRAVRTVN